MKQKPVLSVFLRAWREMHKANIVPGCFWCLSSFVICRKRIALMSMRVSTMDLANIFVKSQIDSINLCHLCVEMPVGLMIGF